MELRSLLNSSENDELPISPTQKALRNDSDALLAMGEVSQKNNSLPNYSKALDSLFPTNGSRGSAPTNITSSLTNSYLFGQSSQNYKSVPMNLDPATSWSNINGSLPGSYHQIQQQALKAFTSGGPHQLVNGSLPDREIRSIRPVQGTYAALKTIERVKNFQIKNEVQERQNADSLSQDFPDVPILLSSDVYETPVSSWSSIWRPDTLEKTYAELYIRDLKNSRDIKRRISEFRHHVDNLSLDDEIWFAKEIPIMHQLSCMNSKKNRNCMGCSTFWKCVQTIQEEIRSWGNPDLLHFEPSHSETFLGHLSMNGSYVPPQREMLACDMANTMFYSDDPQAMAIWGFVPPSEFPKLTEEDSLGIQFYDQKTFIEPAFIEKKVKVTYALQKPGQTIIVPSGWAYWVVYMGRGLTFSASWNFLRLKHINDARRCLEFNRQLCIYKPVNISSLVISAAYQKLDELDTVESVADKRAVCEFLLRILPLLKTLVLEDLLGEHVSMSGQVILSYETLVEMLKKNGRARLPAGLNQEIYQIRNSPLPTFDNDIIDEDDDITYSCYQCKSILFNSRRSCPSCKGYDLCEACFSQVGRLHQHKMKRYRKTPVPQLIELTENVINVLQERDEVYSREPIREASPVPEIPREALEQTVYATRSETNSKRKKREAKLKEEVQQPSDNYDSEVIDCICGNNKDLGSFMISCEKCYAWLHGKCVGISKRNEPDEYYCPRCVKKNSSLANKIHTSRGLSPERKLREYKLA